jgi:hypothetical protein
VVTILAGPWAAKKLPSVTIYSVFERSGYRFA